MTGVDFWYICKFISESLLLVITLLIKLKFLYEVFFLKYRFCILDNQSFIIYQENNPAEYYFSSQMVFNDYALFN